MTFPQINVTIWRESTLNELLKELPLWMETLQITNNVICQLLFKSKSVFISWFPIFSLRSGQAKNIQHLEIIITYYVLGSLNRDEHKRKTGHDYFCTV